MKEAIDTIQALRNELNEVNLLNAKLLYVNKIFKSKNLTESKTSLLKKWVVVKKKWLIWVLNQEKKQGAGLKKAHKLFAKRAADLDDEQYLTVSGWLNCFPLLATAYDLKERLYKVYEVETKEEAWAEYLNWEASIPDELAKPFRPVKTAFRNWKEWILNYFDDVRITNAFTESFNSKVRRVYRDGRGYTFERLRAKVLFTDRLQKRVHIQEKVKVKKKRFEEILHCLQDLYQFQHQKN